MAANCAYELTIGACGMDLLEATVMEFSFAQPMIG